jgi:hypothetical protein
VRRIGNSQYLKYLVNFMPQRLAEATERGVDQLSTTVPVIEIESSENIR